jgi:hypothetical protein
MLPVIYPHFDPKFFNGTQPLKIYRYEMVKEHFVIPFMVGHNL